MFDYTAVNWVAVVAAAVANIVIGFIWYMPMVFGNRWAQATGRPLPQPSQLQPTTYVLGVVVALVTAYVLAVVAHSAAIADLGGGALLGFLAWLGFVATWTYNSVLFEGRTLIWWTINAGNGLVSLVVMGAIIGYWPK